MFLTYSKRKKLILAGLLTCVLLFNMNIALFDTSAGAVSKSEINALKRQQEQLAEKKAGIQAQADAINSKVNSQTEKLSLLNEQLSVTNSEIENLSEQIAIYTNTIAEMENELNIDEQKQKQLLEKYKQRMRVMEENGSISYISILFDVNSFDDLLSRVECIREIMDYDSRLINEVRDAEAKVRSAKADMETEMAEQQQVFSTYQEKQSDLVRQQEEVQTVLSSLTANSADYEAQLASVNAIQSSISGQISNLENELAEQERIKAEQAAARQIQSDNNWYGDSAGTGTGQDIVDYAMKFLGVKYVYGGTSPSGFDCSGLVYYCYRHFGYSVNRTASSLAYNGTAVSSSALQVGDIILFSSKGGRYIGHTGIYIGNGQFIHAPHTGDVVKISSLSEDYYRDHFWGARRVVS